MRGLLAVMCLLAKEAADGATGPQPPAASPQPGLLSRVSDAAGAWAGRNVTTPIAAAWRARTVQPDAAMRLEDTGDLLDAAVGRRSMPAGSYTPRGRMVADSMPGPWGVGSSEAAVDKIRGSLRGRESELRGLSEKLHGPAIRGQLAAEMRGRGYPATSSAARDLAIGSFKEVRPEQRPMVVPGVPLGPATIHSPYDDRNFVNSRMPASHVPLGKSLAGFFNGMDPWLMHRHELEHVRQLPEQGAPPMNKPLPDIRELAASLGDIPFMAEAYKRHAGKPLDVSVEVAPGVVHNADWMARMGRQHGLFAGRSPTELLATPEGQAYLHRLLDAQKTRDDSNTWANWLRGAVGR